MSEQMTFGILGAGNVGVGLAADIEHRGDRAVVYATPGHDRVLNKIEKQGYLESHEALVTKVTPTITHDLTYLINCSDYLVVTVPSAAHDEIISLLKPHKQVLKRKAVIFITGNGIAPLARKQLDLDNAYETSRAPYTVRIEEHANDHVKVRINGFKCRTIIAGVKPPNQSTRDHIRRLFGMEVVWYDNVAQVLLVNNHGLLHAPTMLRNQEQIRQGQKLFFYRDCMNPTVCLEMLTADAELAAIARAMGVEQKESLLETLNGDYGQQHPDMVTFVRKIEALNKRPALPASMQSRQITQDVQILCVLWVSIAEALGVNAPTLRSWIDESSAINNQNYYETGRTLKDYGLGPRPSRDEICAAFNARSSIAESRMWWEERRPKEGFEISTRVVSPW